MDAWTDGFDLFGYPTTIYPLGIVLLSCKLANNQTHQTGRTLPRLRVNAFFP